jgi:hypothetical protein
MITLMVNISCVFVLGGGGARCVFHWQCVLISDVKNPSTVDIILKLFFIVLQLLHQFTSNAKTVHCYTVKMIKKLKIV